MHGSIRSTATQADVDCIVVGGGPAGATAAEDLARAGRAVVLLDRAGRIKPCGGAIPPRCIRDFAIPDEQIVARVTGARITAPSDRHVDMATGRDYVGMVDREHFDEYLRRRAASAGASRVTGTFERIERGADGRPSVVYRTPEGQFASIAARVVIGADGANSAVAKSEVPSSRRNPFVFAYHEIVASPPDATPHFAADRCDIFYRRDFSPDFYAWVFPHGATTSIGTGSAVKGFSLRQGVADLRRATGLGDQITLRREGAPLPLKPLKRWDNGRDVVLVGDAAGVVAPASGEGIYYAMFSARLAAEAVDAALAGADARALATVRKRFMKEHGRVFFVLGMMQHFWYTTDARRERFVSMCRDPDVQRLTWSSYLDKRMAPFEFQSHLKIAMKDFAHLFSMISPWGQKV
jgi:geranylgeranyl reductase